MELFTILLTVTDTTARTIITQQSHSITDLVIAIIASSAATTLLQNIFSWKSNKVKIRKEEQDIKKEKQELKNDEIDLDTRLQTYYKDKYDEVVNELDKLRKELNIVKSKLKNQDKLRKEVAQLKKEKAASCKRVACPNKVI